MEVEAAEAPTENLGLQEPEATFNKGDRLFLRSKPARCILVKHIN